MRILSELRLYLCNHWVTKIPFHGIRKWYYRKVMGFSVDSSSAILMGTTFDAARGLTIGAHSAINQSVRLDTRGGISIGKSVSISADVVILTADHDLQDTAFKGRQRGVNIEDFVFVGTRAMILPGVSLGKGAVVAAGAVVTKPVEPYSIVAGIPAKEIGKRNQNLDYKVDYQRLFF